MTWTIRVAEASDAAAVARVYAPHVTDSAVSFETVAPDAAEFERRMAAYLARYPWLVCERSGEFAGYAYGSSHRDRAAYRWSVETSVYVADAFRRVGVARALYHALLEILTVQGFGQAFAGITLPNEASVRFHESLGFEHVALYRAVGFKHAKWHDVAWLQRPLIGAAAAPADPIPFPSLADSDIVRTACARAVGALA